jgi:Tol biopolymer transport system component
MKTRKISEHSYCLLPLAFSLLFLLILVLSGCEKCSPPQKAPEETKPVWNSTGEGFRTGRNDSKEIEINLKEIRLATIPEDYERWDSVSFSSDGRQVFYKARKKDREFIVVASARGRSASNMIGSSTDGEKTGPVYEGVSFLVRSPDGRRFAFGGKKGGKKYLVIDNKELNYLYHDEVAPSAFSPDGRLVVCEVENREKKEWFVVVHDGEKEVHRSQAFPDTFMRTDFSPDSRLLVYELGEKNKKRIVFSLDLVTRKIIKEQLYDERERTGRLSFSSDSSRVIHELIKEGKHSLVLHDFALDEEREIELPYTRTVMLFFSPDGKKIAYIATVEGKNILVVSPWESPALGKEKGPYDGISPATFSPGSTAVAYLAMKEGKWRIVVEDKEGANYDRIGDTPVFSPDGAKTAYPAIKNGKWVMVVSPAGNPAAVKEGPAYDMVVTPVFSPDGRYVAYRARTGTMENAKRFIVIADAETGKVIKEGTVCDEVWPPVWSANGKSAAYGARIGRELWWKVESVE